MERFEEMSLDEAYRIIDGLKTGVASGYDRITCKFVKSMRGHIGPFMQSSVKRMFFEGIFPYRLKVSRVTPIYKKGDKQEAQNYRPILVLPVYSKIFETSIKSRLCNNLSRPRIIHRNQFEL
jgi:hypothetical protein